MSWLVSPFAPEAYWWLDVLGLAACAVAWLWMRRVDRQPPTDRRTP